MAERSVNGARLYYEERGSGAPILCIHGTGSSALVWAPAVPQLARLGRVISYDRRGCTRSERPQPYERTSVAEHAADATALLDALADAPAVVIGRSYGGEVAIELALHHPHQVRALALLEPGALGLSPAYTEWDRALADRICAVAAQAGNGAVAEAFIGEVLGDAGWNSFPHELRRMFTDNGPAILAELAGGALEMDAAVLAAIEQPVLLVSASDSPPAFRDVIDAMADALPHACTALVGGGHLIDPAGPEVLAFIEQVLTIR